MLVDVTLQKARAILGAETFFRQQVDGLIRDLESLALALHLLARPRQVKFGDLPHLIHRQRRENNDLVDSVAELRREPGFRGLHDFLLDGAEIWRRLRSVPIAGYRKRC